MTLLLAAAGALASQTVEVSVRRPDGPQHWDCGVRGALVLRNPSDSEAEVVVKLEATPDWRIDGLQAPFERTVQPGAFSEHWFRLVSPGPRRDDRIELRVSGLREPVIFEVTSLGEVLCH